MNLTLLRRRNNGNLSRLRDEMDRMFDQFLVEPVGLLDPKVLRTEGWLPPIDISDTENEVVVRVEAPGIAVKDLEVLLTGTTLMIMGKKDELKEKQEENYYQCERRFGEFRRELELPEGIDPEKVAAEADNGVITIRVAKKPGAKPRHIEVKPVSKRIPVA
ncbi:Spore protein SP21 [Phycisphaerales bacterium]|nr:Spore protein SP21 [Phycisphaerales bacterium]